MQAAAGFLVRFLLIFTLTSDQDPDYMHLHTMKGILTASPVRPCLHHFTLHALLDFSEWLVIHPAYVSRPLHATLAVCYVRSQKLIVRSG